MDSKLPLINVITVVFNGAPYITDTINSVLKNPYPNLQYIIIDGGSTDGTPEIIKKYEKHLKYWISEPDKGIYDAMNKGWAVADKESYIIYLGAGDRLINLPQMLKYKDADIIYGRVEIGKSYVFNTKADFRLKLINSTHHQALLVKKNIHPEPPFLLKFPVFADFDFNQRLYKSGLKFIKDPSFLSYAMQGGVSSIENKKEMLAVVNNNYGKLYMLLASVYYSLQKIRNRLTGFKS